MNKIKYIICFLLCLSCLIGKSQDNKAYVTISKEETVKLLQQVNHWYASTKTYSFSIIHSTYAGHKATVPYDQKKGYFKKFSSGFHSYVAGLHSLQNKNYLIIIDSVKKIILVNDPKNFENNGFSSDDYIKALDKCNSLKISDDGKIKTVRMEFAKNAPVASYELGINKQGNFHAITICYAREVKSLQGEMVKPKLNILFEKYSGVCTPERNELNDAVFFSVNANVLKLRDEYKDYKLLDQRIKNEKP